MFREFGNFGRKSRISDRAQQSRVLLVVFEFEVVATFFRLAGGHSMIIVIVHVIRRVATPKSNTERGAIA